MGFFQHITKGVSLSIYLGGGPLLVANDANHAHFHVSIHDCGAYSFVIGFKSLFFMKFIG